MKDLKDLRAVRKGLNKHMVVMRLTDAEEEQLVKILEETRTTFTLYLTNLLRPKLVKQQK